MNIKKTFVIVTFLLFFFSNTNAEENFIVVFESTNKELSQDLFTFLEESNYSYTSYSPKDKEFLTELEKYKKEHRTSKGLSKNFRHYPIIFFNDKAFSGFNREAKKEL